MRRFQELSFQIVRSRNERRLQAKKDSWDETARNQPYNVGDYVLVKNNNPASGPGKMKLRAKYIGPFRVIKVYLSSLIVVPWTQNARLEEYYRDPNVFRLMHRGDIKPFHTRQVSVRHCKPFKGQIRAEEIVDPIMLSRFLDDLGVKNDIEVLSEIDPESTITDSTGSGSTRPPPGGSTSRGSSPPPPSMGGDDGPLPRYDDPDPEFKESPVGSENNEPGSDTPGYNSDTERFISNLDISDDDKDLLRYYCQIKDEIREYKSFQSQRAFNDEECSEKLDRLRDFLRSADPAIREKAEDELQQIVEDMKYVYQHELMDKFKEDYYKIAFKSDSGKKESQSKAASEISSLKSEPVHADSNPASVHGDNVSISNSDHADMPELEDDDNLSQDSNLTWDHGADFADPGPYFDPPMGPGPPIINIINSPNVNVNTGLPAAARLPPRIPARPSRARDQNPPAKTLKRLRTPEDRAKRKSIENWLVGQSPRQGQSPPEDPEPEAGDPGDAPKVTRSGRLSKPVIKFDSAAESQMQKDLRTAMKQSLPPAKASGSKTVTTARLKSAVAGGSKATTAKKSVGAESEKSKNTTAKAKTVVTKSAAASKAPVASNKDKDSISGKSKVTEKTPGANRLSDDELDNPMW
jgi:hypothetical protein